MSTDYNDILDAAIPSDDTPRRTRKGALKYQPADTDWSLDRLPELQDFYQSTYKRSLPVTVKGQGSIHNRWGYDHRASADLSLNPASEEGQALIAELQRRRIPFLAFEGTIPGASTGPHIHVGRPSHRTSARYGVGAQVKGQRKPAPAVDTYDDVIAAAVGEADQKPASQSAQPVQSALDPLLHQLGRINDASDPGAPAGVGELRRIEGREQRAAADTGMGRLHQLDDFETTAIIANRKYVEGEVRRQRQSGAGAFLGPLGRGLDRGVRDPYGAASDVLAGRTEEESIAREADHRIQTSREDTERLREIRQQFTDEDRAQLADALSRMRGQGSISRGIETGSQRVGSGLLYKLGGLADLVAAAGGSGIAGRQFPRTQLGDYLRRQAGRGELAIGQIEAEMPPDLRQQFADFATHAVGALPEIFGATAVAGPVGGFAALGGLEAVGRKESFADVAKETAKGAVLGAVFKGAGAAETLPGTTLGQRAVNTAESGAAVGLGTYAVEKAFGADDYNAARSAASNVLLHAGMRIPGEMARLTTAAERALKTPPAEEPTPTVPADLQERLAREGQPIDTAPVAANLKTPAIPPADLTSRPVPAEPVAEPSIAVEPATPSRPRNAPQPIPEGGTPLHRWELYDARTGEVVDHFRTKAEAREQESGKYRARPATTYIPNEPLPNPTIYAEPPSGQAKAPLFDLLRERTETGPTESAAVNLIAGKPVKGRTSGGEGMDRAAKVLNTPLEQYAGNPTFRELVRRELPEVLKISRTATTFRDFEEAIGRLSQEPARDGPNGRQTRLLGRLLEQFGPKETYEALRTLARKGEAGYIDLNEIREGVRAGKVKVEEALGQLKLRFPSRTEGQLHPLLNRQHDPLIGIVKGGAVESYTDYFREREHYDVFEGARSENRWRYEPSNE